MSISSSYPYLSIAKRHGRNYGEILNIVEKFRTTNGLINAYQIGDIAAMLCYDDYAVYCDIEAAAHYCNNVRTGRAPFPPTSRVLDMSGAV